jgi:hypothetical protein
MIICAMRERMSAMSNFLAIATATATLKNLLYDTAKEDVSDHHIEMTTGRPDGAITPTTDAKLNIYLYQVTPNTALRNKDLPTRRADGTTLQPARVALDLHYMIIFYGDENNYVPQRLLGSVVRTLHAQPFLSRDRIRLAIALGPSFLATSNLADEVELVKFTPLHLSLEELSKIWSVFFQIPYTLSVAYQGSVVLIESDDASQRSLPVRASNIYTVQFHQPVIERIVSQVGENEPIVADSTLLIIGKRLQGDVTLIRIGGVDLPLSPPDVSETQLRLPLSTVADLRAGVQGLQIVHQMLMGSPPVPHLGVESNVGAFVLRPTIKSTGGDFDITISNLQGSGDEARSADVTVNVQPAIGRTQRVTLLLNEANPPGDRPARAYTFDAPPRNQPGSPEASNTIIFSIWGVRAGTYLVRIQVDGAESLLSTNATGQYDAPQVNIS